MSKVKELGADFQQFVNSGVAVVDFWAGWCGPCRMIAPIIDDLAEELSGVAFGKVDVDANQQLAVQYSITSIPNICIFKDGMLVDRIIGVQQRDVMLDKITKYM